MWKARGGDVPGAHGVQGTRRLDDKNWEEGRGVPGWPESQKRYLFIFIFF